MGRKYVNTQNLKSLSWFNYATRLILKKEMVLLFGYIVLECLFYYGILSWGFRQVKLFCFVLDIAEAEIFHSELRDVVQGSVERNRFWTVVNSPLYKSSVKHSSKNQSKA